MRRDNRFKRKWFFVIEFDEITSIREEINDKDEARRWSDEDREWSKKCKKDEE